MIEPGHFRFSVVGETIIDMKSRLYFTHKGTEKLFEGRDAGRRRGAGRARVRGHDRRATRSPTARRWRRRRDAVPDRARYLRVILLEMERLYNHVGDFGMIANDTGYAVAHSHCFRIRERLLRLNKRLTGNRLLRGGLVPAASARTCRPGWTWPPRWRRRCADFDEIVELSLGNTLVMDRLEGTGRLTTRTARDHGVLGYVARASGIDVDVRRDHPFAAYGELSFRVPVLRLGRREGAHARARRGGAGVGQADPAGGGGAARRAARGAAGPAPGLRAGVLAGRGLAGAIIHWVMADGGGRLYRVKIMDPSFLNWRPLSYALLKNIVPDFPLCNKSFNQSYSGNDL